MSNTNTPVKEKEESYILSPSEKRMMSIMEERMETMEASVSRQMDTLTEAIQALVMEKRPPVKEGGRAAETPLPGRAQYFAESEIHTKTKRNLSNLEEFEEDEDSDDGGLAQFLTVEERRGLKELSGNARRATVHAEGAAQRDPPSGVTRLTLDQKKVEPVRVWFNARKATLSDLTFENYLRWDTARKSYERQYPDEWKNNWTESFASNIKTGLYAFNYTPADSTVGRQTMSGDVKLGIVFATIKNDALRSSHATTLLRPGMEFNYNTELSTLPIASVIDLIMLAVTPETKAGFRTAFQDAMTKTFQIKNKTCNLDFHKLEPTSMFNIAAQYQTYVDFLEEANRIYHKLLELRKKAAEHKRRADMPRFDDKDGTRDLLKTVCKNAGASYLVYLMNQIRDNPSDVVIQELEASRKEELETRKQNSKKATSRYEDQSDTFQKLKVHSLAELFDLLRLELDDQRRLSRPVMQRMEELKTSASDKDGPTLSAVWRDTGEVGSSDEESDSAREPDVKSVLQAFTKPAYGGRPSTGPPIDKSKWVCSRRLSGLPCPDKDGKLCEGHSNNNPDDKAAYVARQLPIVQEKLRWFKEREDALLKSQKDYPLKASPSAKHLHAITYALDPDDEYQHSMLRDAPGDDLDPDKEEL